MKLRAICLQTTLRMPKSEQRPNVSAYAGTRTHLLGHLNVLAIVRGLGACVITKQAAHAGARILVIHCRNHRKR